MNLSASKPLKLAYSITILTAIIPIGLASSSWVALTTGGRFGAPFIIGPVIFLIFGIYRIVTIYKNPYALRSFPLKGFANVLRKLGIFALYVGALISLVNVLSIPLVLMLGAKSGTQFLVVGMYLAGVFLAYLTNIGTIGLVSFELSRILGFEERARIRAASIV